jgi:N-methylhydantoinase A/oxoprolinase/acetone carboxylase beta subunit
VGLIERLIRAVEGHMEACGIRAPLMVVRGDGALMAAQVAHEKPIETILSGPAASAAGAAWLAREPVALVSDIGGTTTDICLLRDGRPAIDPEGARVGPFRTMVEAVAMRTWGLGGDSEVHLLPGLSGELHLGPRRVIPVSLLARDHPELVHRTLDAALATERANEESGRFVLPLWGSTLPPGLDVRELAVAGRLEHGPVPIAEAVRARPEGAALNRLVTRGLAQVSAVTPTDAAHVLGLQADFDAEAARKALRLFGRRRTGAGDRLAEDPDAVARAILDRLTHQTSLALLEAAFAEEGWPEPDVLARHRLARAGLERHEGLVRVGLSLGVPVIALGASAATHYPPVGARLGTRALIPEHAEVANAVGAVVGRVAVTVEGTVTSPAPGSVIAHLPAGPARFGEPDAALAALAQALDHEATARARAAGAGEVELLRSREVREAEVEGSPMFIEARLRVTAQGRARLATS